MCQHASSNWTKSGGHVLSIFGRSPFLATRLMNSVLFIPLKGTLSLAICHSNIPKEYTSAFSLYRNRNATSGAMYLKLPVLPVISYVSSSESLFRTHVQSPKSKSFTSPDSVKPMLSGLMSPTQRRLLLYID